MPPTVDSDVSEVHLGEHSQTDRVELDPDKPFRILLVGDFSGRAWRKNPPHTFTPQPVDRDNFDEVLEDMQVSLRLHGATIPFREMEDFHPDHIYQAAASIFRDVEKHLEQAKPAKAAPASAPRAASSGSLLDQIVNEQGPPEPVAPASLEDANDLASFIQRVSRGYTEPRPDASQQQRAARRHALSGDVMRGILHHPRVQALESAWRALFMLVRGLDTDGGLKLYVLNITLPELISEMETVQKDLRRKGPWAVIVGNYSFGQSELEAQALQRLARMAGSLHAPFLAGAHLHGKNTAEDAWSGLRHSPEARWIGLAMPRFLLRLPYGKDTSAIESFPFEEMPKSDHNDYLWGNPAFFCGYLLGKSFLAHGWNLNPLERRIDGLPMHVYQEDGEPVAKPCAEVLLTEREAMKMLDAGFMPLASLKHEPAALIVRFQSIAEPAAPLAGIS
ncbi:MAG TPA: type VI secretion system contractile sheath large subunit [Bryobacteraceae bacterium]|nr:type VI secretion system contractile sheath large subunit [Bryobacteraceae bacterium]